MPDFLLSAGIAGLLMACLAGPLGSVVVWRRLSYFGETLAHGGLLGVALGLALSMPTQYGVLICGCLLALSLAVLRRHSALSSDTVLGILSHGSLALGLIAISLLPNQINLESLLFGDLLAVAKQDIYWMLAINLLVLSLLASNWHSLVAWAVHEELAQVEGIKVKRVEILFMLAIAVTVAVAMKVVGIMLITALLIIPAATARRLSRSPEAMAIGATLVAASAVILGLGLSLWADTPTGPSVIAAALLLFLLVQLLPQRL
jgi:zinc transport system permease protein